MALTDEKRERLMAFFLETIDKGRDSQAVKLAMAYQDKFGALEMACRIGKKEVAMELIRKGWDIRETSRDNFLCTPLHSALRQRSPEMKEVVLELVKRGVHLLSKDYQGFTPLRCALLGRSWTRDFPNGLGSAFKSSFALYGGE